ncbi:hypothetical protein PAHAL_8G215400 [Panicum hallii]|uniref:Uncharacterized protein n=1 Tax=Panicum hallii TaxID=206008 RepID=A0A2S3IEX5_9POAL|nr:hypothetical protein PAHAL_8G215400 [Panicum hallii]
MEAHLTAPHGNDSARRAPLQRLSCQFKNMEEEEGASLLFMHDEPRIRAPQSPVLSPSISSLRKHLKRCNKKKKALRVAGQLNASIMTPDRVALEPWTFNQAVSCKELMSMIVLHELPFSLVEYDGFRSS